MRCLNFLEHPHAWRILLDGEGMGLTDDKNGALMVRSPVQLQRLRSEVSTVFQHFNLWPH